MTTQPKRSNNMAPRCNKCGAEYPRDVMRQVMILAHDATHAARMGERVACIRDLQRALRLVKEFHAKCEGVPGEEPPAVKNAIRREDIITNDDGYRVYWPGGSGRGYLTATDLRDIADELDCQNAAWDAQVQSDPQINGR